MTKKKSKKFYVWYTKSNAGISSNYETCNANYVGQPGGGNQSFGNKEDALIFFKLKMNELGLEDQSCLNLEKQSSLYVNTTVEPAELLNTQSNGDEADEAPKGSGETLPFTQDSSWYEQFSELRTVQSDFNAKVNKTISELSIEISELSIEGADQKCRFDNKLKEMNYGPLNYSTPLKAEIDLAMEKLNDISKGQKSLDKQLQRMQKKQENISRSCSTFSCSLFDDSKQNSSGLELCPTHDTPGKSVMSSVRVKNRFELLSTVDTDITQDEVTNGCLYNEIVIHTGTNDIARMCANNICENIARIVVDAQAKWPSSNITISGITYRRDANTKLNEVIDDINAQSKLTCAELGRVCFMDNSHQYTLDYRAIDVSTFHDDRHLSNKGIRKLAAN
ncbi:predicted protein [Nematostella vectensis]|uniref:SGNH hydrolase-type esterase domain-containing protein n=1 Tax=Nematostella vectensis TaxID=45351 RepID=A7RSM3_NEMVE|nr:predicted protein [Nematostella vectensis]|eukprot:XP_001637719.1 predicted protein [Nematostella vectensis]